MCAKPHESHSQSREGSDPTLLSLTRSRSSASRRRRPEDERRAPGRARGSRSAHSTATTAGRSEVRVQANLVELGGLEAIEIDVNQRDAATAVLVDDCQ